MKKTARLISFSLALIMLLASFVACAETADQNDETTLAAATEAPATTVIEETTESPYDEEGYLKSSLPDELDFGGETVTVLWWNDVEQPEFFVEQTNGELINDAIWQRNANVEEKMGVTLAWVDIKGQYNSDGPNYANHVGNMYASGDTTYDLMSAHSRTMALTAMSGYCAEMTKLDYLDFDMPWWPEVMLDTATINEKLYFVTGDVSTNSIHQMYVMFYNKDILAGYPELVEPSQSVKDGTWTLEALQTLTRGLYQDMDGDNKQSSGDFYGFSSLNWHFDAIYYGAGLRQAEKDADTLMKISPDYFSEKADTLVNIVGEWVKQGDVYINSTYYDDVFVNGNSLMVMARHKDVAEQIVDAGFSYGIVPIPKYNTDQERHITCVGNPCSLYSIFVNSADTNRAAAVLECWASEAYRTTTPAVFETTMKLRYSETSVESQMYDIIRAGIIFDFGRLFNGDLGAMSDQWDNAAIAGTPWASIAKRMQKQLDKQFKAIIDSFIALEN